jgi:hypothetical protein
VSYDGNMNEISCRSWRERMIVYKDEKRSPILI